MLGKIDIMKKQVVGAALVLATFFGTVSQASALTVAQFDTLSLTTQGQALQSILNGTYKNLQSQNAEANRLSCIAGLFTSASTDAVSNGIKYLSKEIEKARQSNPSIRVEDIVLGVMDRECAKPSTKKADKAPSVLEKRVAPG